MGSICLPSSRNDEHAESRLTKYFGTIVGDKHDPFLLTSIMMLHTLLLEAPRFQIFLRRACSAKFLDWPARSIKTRGYGFPTTPWFDLNDMLCKEPDVERQTRATGHSWSPMKLYWSVAGERGMDQRSFRDVIGCRHFLVSRTLHK